MRSLLLAALLLATPLCAQAAWQLSEEQSSVTYVSTKNNAVGENNTFGKVSGAIEAQESRVVIDLSSVDTGIGIRNERMQKMLFETEAFGEAVVIVPLGEEALSDLPVGELRRDATTLSLTLHGETRELQAEMQVARLDESTLLIHSVSPVIVSAGDFGLVAGVEALREVAGLDSISTAVPVSFTLVFTQ